MALRDDSHQTGREGGRVQRGLESLYGHPVQVGVLRSSGLSTLRNISPCRARPRLALETDPFSLDNYKTVLQINNDLVVSYKSPIARDFRLYFRSKTQVDINHLKYFI